MCDAHADAMLIAERLAEIARTLEQMNKQIRKASSPAPRTARAVGGVIKKAAARRAV